MRQDDRTAEEKQSTIGFWVATDKFLSGWGNAPGRSLVACPVTSAEDSEIVERRFNLRSDFKRVRWVSGKNFYPRMSDRDHLHIYDTKTSFRYPL
jgi:hypothetical protein